MTAVGDYKTYFTEMITTCDLSLLILTNKQTNRQTDIQTNRQTDIQTNRLNPIMDTRICL